MIRKKLVLNAFVPLLLAISIIRAQAMEPPFLPITITPTQVQIFPQGAEKIKVQWEFNLNEASDGINPAVESVVLRLWLPDGSQFYPSPFNDYMPVFLAETESWAIPQAERSRTNIEVFEIQPDSERVRYFYGKLLTVRDFDTEQHYLVEKLALEQRLIMGFSIGNDAGSTEIPLAENNGKYTLPNTLPH